MACWGTTSPPPRRRRDNNSDAADARRRSRCPPCRARRTCPRGRAGRRSPAGPRASSGGRRVLLRLGEDRLGRGRGRRRDEGPTPRGRALRNNELHLTCARSDGRLRLAAASRWRGVCAAAASSLQPALAASRVAWPSSARRARVAAAVQPRQVTPFERSTGAALAAVAFFAKTPARWRAVASSMPAYRRRGVGALFGSRREDKSSEMATYATADAAFAASCAAASHA